MPSISEVVDTLKLVLRQIDQVAEHFRESRETWEESDSLLRTALTGSRDSDAEPLLAQFALIGVTLGEQRALLNHTAALINGIITRLIGFGTPEWVAEVGQRIDPAKTKVTTGIGFDDQGKEHVRLASGRDDVSAAAQERLAASPQYPKPPGWRPGMLFAAAEHSETKHAIWMRAHGIRHLTVVINHPRLCGPPYGCEVAVRTLLPKGWTMNVVSSASGRTWTLRGVAEE